DMRSALQAREKGAGYRAGMDSILSGTRWFGQGTELKPSTASPESEEDFATAWQRFCSRNPRLRDPKALPGLMRRGVPAEMRREVWSFCLGVSVAASGSPSSGEAAPQTVAEEAAAKEEASSDLSQTLLDVIEADVARTFPNNKEFQDSGGPDNLRQVLIELARQDSDLGYCQSLNFIAANFLMVLGNPDPALAAVRQLLTKLQTRQWYTDGMKQLRADTTVLEEMLRERLPAVHSVLAQHRFDFLFVTSKWFLCLFAATLADEALHRVWDVLLGDGIEAVFRISLSLFALQEKAILSVKSHDDLIHLMQEWQPDCSPEVIIQTAYHPSLAGLLSRKELDLRRRKAADEISSADTRAEMRITHLKRGGVRPASILA
ncbi:TBC1D2, partial [Symbiodinium pilosum]